MFYREAGQFKTSYAADMAVFPLRQDRIGLAAIIAVAYAVAFTGSDFLLQAVLIPFLIFALAAIGLNLLTGYAGLLSLGTGAFMGVGAYACYKLTTAFPGVNFVVWVLVSGLFSAGIGVFFGLPSLRIKGFYLAVATLAAQFFLQWCFNRVPWLYNYNVSGAIDAPLRTLFGVPIVGPTATSQTRYLVVLTLVILLTWVASNLVHGRIGRMWMAIRDMDIAAELMGIKLLQSKLLAFAVSSYYCGVAGAMMVFFWYGGAEYNVFDINQSFYRAVHDHHRRPRQPDRLVLRGGLDLHAADRARHHPAGDPRSLRAVDRVGYHRALALYHPRGSHHLLPDRRAARPCAALADRQTEAPGLAVPLLNGRPPAAERVEETSGSLKKAALRTGY